MILFLKPCLTSGSSSDDGIISGTAAVIFAVAVVWVYVYLDIFSIELHMKIVYFLEKHISIWFSCICH